MLAGTKQDILPIGLMIWCVWGCSIDSITLRAFQSSLSEYLFSPFFHDSILAIASSWAFLPRMTFLNHNYLLKHKLPEVTTNHIILHTTPIGWLVIQTLIYSHHLPEYHTQRESGIFLHSTRQLLDSVSFIQRNGETIPAGICMNMDRMKLKIEAVFGKMNLYIDELIGMNRKQ